MDLPAAENNSRNGRVGAIVLAHRSGSTGIEYWCTY